MLKRNPAVAVFFTLVCACLLSACSNEEAQRKAFMEFLQTRIIDKPGVHVPVLKDEDRKVFGDYSAQYAVMQNFHESLNKRTEESLNTAMKQMNISSMGQAMQRREDIQSAQKVLNELPALISEEQAKADDVRKSFQQPEDLKAVYTKAYDRVVTQPAEAMKSMMPVASETLTATLEALDYIHAHQNVIKVNGAMIEVSDPAIQKELNTRLQALNAKAQATMQAQRKMVAIIYGRG
jgi:hypothetical protein